MNERVIDMARGFRRFWTNRLSNYPKYRLDLTWPSVAVVDMILSPMRGQELSKEQEEIVLAASAYLTCIVYNTWSSFGGEFSVEITFEEEIVLRGRGGRYLTDTETVTLPLSAAVKETLQRPADPFNFYEKTARPLRELSSPLSALMIGICTGLSPHIDGPWRRYKDVNLPENLKTTNGFLAHTTAEHYVKVFPGEILGADSRVFECNLILPPLLHMEQYSGTVALHTLSKFFAQEELSLEEVAELALNLSQFPDPQLRTVGFLLAASLCDTPIPQKLLFAAQCLDVGALANSVGIGRQIFGRPFNWAKNLKEADRTALERHFHILRSLGLAPLMRIDPMTFLEPGYHPLLLALIKNDEMESLEQIRMIVDLDRVVTPGLLLQAVALEIATGELELADKRLKELVNSGATQYFNLEERAITIELSASLQLAQGNLNLALEQFERSLSLGIKDEQTFLNAAHNALALELARGDFEHAMITSETLLKRHPHSINARLAQAVIAHQREEFERSELLLKELLTAAPSHRSVFHFLLTTLG